MRRLMLGNKAKGGNRQGRVCASQGGCRHCTYAGSIPALREEPQKRCSRVFEIGGGGDKAQGNPPRIRRSIARVIILVRAAPPSIGR
jgi:hypothetical protein